MSVFRQLLAYESLRPIQKQEQLAVDLDDPDFYKVAIATFNPAKYYLKPEALKKFLDSHKAADIQYSADPGTPITARWPGWDVMAAMSMGLISGDEAKLQFAQHFVDLDGSSQDVILKVLDKTWRNGVTADMINLVRPNTFRPAKFMLAHNIEDRLDKGKVVWPMLATTKYDGFRAIFCQNTHDCLSRLGNPFPIVDPLRIQLVILGRTLKDVYGLDYVPALDGELFNGDWAATAEARASGYSSMIIFGMLPSEMIWGGTSEPFHVEFFLDVVDYLIEDLKLSLLRTPFRQVVNNVEEMESLFQRMLDEGHEGLVLSAIERPYEGKRSYLWLKKKASDPIDAEICGVIIGAPRSKNEGKVVGVEVLHNGVVSGVSGMNQALIEKCTELHAQGELTGLTVEVVIHELTPDGALRHGRVKNIRFDK